MEKGLDLQFSNFVAPLPIINYHSLISATYTSEGRKEVENKAARERREKGEGGRADTCIRCLLGRHVKCLIKNR